MTERHLELERLVMEDEIDQVLSLVSLDEIAFAWRSCVRDQDDRAGWAFALLCSGEMFRRRDLYRSLLLKLVEHADEATLGRIGAGPLEDFVSEDEDELVWLEQQCAVNPGLRVALSGVWCDDVFSEETMRRLDHAAGVKLPRLGPLDRELPPTT